MKKYKHEIWTGCGRIIITLEVEESEANLNYFSNWMGEGEINYKLIFKHKKLGSLFGLLELKNVTGDLKAPQEVFEYIKDNDYITFEYVSLTTPQENFQVDSALEPIKIMGKAGWNEKFEIVIFLSKVFDDFAYDEDEEINLFVRKLKTLDKIKLGQTID